MPNLSLRDKILWIVGYTEGEGCFGFRRCPVIEVNATDEDVVKRCQTYFGGGFTGPRVAPGPRKPFWTWKVTGVKAVGLMMTIYPFMGMRRKQKIHDVLTEWKARPPAERYKTHCPRKHPYSDENTYSYQNRKGSWCRQCRVCARQRYTNKLAGLDA